MRRWCRKVQSMPEKFDHIEKSIQGAFENFEMPTTDLDWSKIQAGIPKQSKKRRFLVWWTQSRIWGLGIVAGLVLLTTGIGTYFTASNEPIATPRHEQIKKEVTAAAPKSNKLEESTSAIETPISQSNEVAPSASSESTAKASQKTKQYVEVKGEARNTKQANSLPQESTQAVNPGEQPKVANAPAAVEPPQTTKNHSGLKAFGIRLVQMAFPSLFHGLRIDKDKVAPFERPQKPNPSNTIQFYTALSASYSPGKITSTSTSEIWKGVNWSNGSNPAADIRLEGGIEFGNKWKFTTSLAFEGNPVASRSQDTIRIQIADRFLPYYDQNGVLLYMLAVKWRDSLVVLRKNQQRLWMEIPLGIKRSWTVGKNLTLTTGISLNPGVRLASKGDIANPYQSFSGSYLKYQYGLNADTTSTTLPLNQFSNQYRLGNGLQIGIQKDYKIFYMGAEINSRYYYTPVWKNETPFKQQTLQYGVQFKIGFKI